MAETLGVPISFNSSDIFLHVGIVEGCVSVPEGYDRDTSEIEGLWPCSSCNGTAISLLLIKDWHGLSVGRGRGFSV